MKARDALSSGDIVKVCEPRVFLFLACKLIPDSRCSLMSQNRPSMSIVAAPTFRVRVLTKPHSRRL